MSGATKVDDLRPPFRDLLRSRIIFEVILLPCSSTYVDVRDNARDLASALGAPARHGGRLLRLLLDILV